MRPLACVILAAGEGKRMKSVTPKPLHEICGKSMIDHVLDAVSELDPERSIVVVGVGAGQLCEAIGDRAVTCEQVKQRGTGDAAICAAPGLEGFEGDVLVTCGDVPLITAETLRRLVEAHYEHDASATVLTTTVDDPTGYGRILRDSTGAVAGIVEHRDADPEQLAICEINTGIYVFESRALAAALGEIRADNEQGELYLTDAIKVLVSYGRPVAGMIAEDPAETMGVNDRVQLAEAERIARDRIRERLMRDGVTLVDPPSTFIDPGVTVGLDTVIGPGCHLLGDTSVGAGCEIRGHVVLRSSKIGSDVLLRDHTVIEDSAVGDSSQIGPFSLIRGNSSVGEDCRVGSSSEMNRSNLGDGTKMQHFAYLGDTTVGKCVNIGAGAITCNYDGLDKHPTTIGDGAFVGSDVILIAPITIGEEAYTGAGSVLTRDVAPGTLALERGDQRVIEDWAERMRRRREGREQS